MDGKVDDLQAECCKHDIYVNKDSLEVARLAAGSAIQLTKDIITGKVQNGMCVTRPPGHHAMKAEPNGFCLCNNVGIAAKYALANSFQKVESATNQEACCPWKIASCCPGSNFPEEKENSSSPQINVRKILIVDFDVHHGNGTQEIIEALMKPKEFTVKTDVSPFSIFEITTRQYRPWLDYEDGKNVLFASVHLFDNYENNESSECNSEIP